MSVYPQDTRDMEEHKYVRLRCIKERSRLRVRITSPGYNPHANCQFPRAIRQEGREYIVPASDITFSEGAHKFFYRVKKDNVEIVDELDNGSNTRASDRLDLPNLSGLQIYDGGNDECCICMDAPKDSVFYPCGHYYCCGNCAQILNTSNRPCPICRVPITQVVGRDQIQ